MIKFKMLSGIICSGIHWMLYYRQEMDRGKNFVSELHPNLSQNDLFIW